MHHWQPRVEAPRQTHQTLRGRWQSAENRLIEAYPDGELDEHRSQASNRVHTVVAVELHRLLGDARLVALVPLLDLLELRLKGAHSLDLAALLHGKGVHDAPNEHREYDYAEPEVVEQNAI